MNSGPLGPEPSALPAALHPVKLCYYTPQARYQLRYTPSSSVIILLFAHLSSTISFFFLRKTGERKYNLQKDLYKTINNIFMKDRNDLSIL